MFCPRCAAHNIDDAKYCRVCGADISLLPQVLSGALATGLEVAEETAVEEKGKSGKRKGKKKDKEKETPTLEKAFENIGVGIAFLIISIMVAVFMPGGRFWWFWLLIPTGACAGEGIGQLLGLKREKSLGGSREPQLRAPHQTHISNLPPRDTSEMLMPPPSITENTTRHLGPDPRAGSFDEAFERPQSTHDSNLK